MDLALALVEEDHGREVALGVARELVIFARRPGGQSQFSAHLSAQLAERDALRELQRYILEHVEADLSIAACAKRVSMSPRNFARAFVREVGTTPAAWIESVRVERARELLETTHRSVESISIRCGFPTSETMRRAFVRALGVPPRSYREHFQAKTQKPSEVYERSAK